MVLIFKYLYFKIDKIDFHALDRKCVLTLELKLKKLDGSSLVQGLSGSLIKCNTILHKLYKYILNCSILFPNANT